MGISWIAFPLAGLSGGVVITLLYRHWKEIRLLDPSSLKDEQERERRHALIFRRFERLRAEKMRPLLKMGREVSESLSRLHQRTAARVEAFEAFYKQAKRPFAAPGTPNMGERIKALLTEARALARDLKWGEAERRYLEVVSLDARHAEAYQGLGQIYLKQKLYPQAKETLEFLIKRKQADDATYAGLAEIAEANDRMEEAKTWRIKAVEASPRHGHRHAELAAFYLARGQGEKAREAAEQACELEPGSPKYLELSLEIAILLHDRKAAEDLYDRLRLVTSDSAKFRVWRERIDHMP